MIRRVLRLTVKHRRGEVGTARVRCISSQHEPSRFVTSKRIRNDAHKLIRRPSFCSAHSLSESTSKIYGMGFRCLRKGEE